MRRWLLILPLLAMPAAAEAVVVSCTGGFRPCDPTTGLCYDAWTVANAGIVQANCSADPTSCWRQMMADPTCKPTVPTNPDSLRVCPAGADCGPGFPINLWGFPDRGARFGWPPDSEQFDHRAPPGKIWWCYRDQPGTNPPMPIPGSEPIDTLGCEALIYFAADAVSHWPAPPTYPHCPACDVFHQIAFPGGGGSYSYGNGYAPYLDPRPFEAPASSCGWTFAPATGANACTQAGSPLLITLKVINLIDGVTTSDRLQRRHDELLRRIVRTERNLRDGLYGSINSIWARAERMWRVTMIAEVAALAQAMVDPPNTAYQAIPPLPSLALPDTITAGPDMTQQQADAWNAWAAKHRLYMQAWNQIMETYDNLAGAMLANDAVWVRRLAVAAEDVAAYMSARWQNEQAKRATLAAAYPSHPDLGAGCSTPTDMLVRLYDLAGTGDRLYGAHLQYEAGLAAPCAVTDESFAAAMTSTPVEIITAFSTPGIRHRIGAATGYDSSRSAVTLTTKTLVGKINVTVKVAAQAGEPYGVKAGDIVQLSIPGLPPQPDAVLGTGNTVLVKVLGVPPGTYAVTVTYPEQRSAKMVSSAATITVTVQ